MSKVDYLIVGAGAVGLAFADTLIQESDATVAIVDRNERPGGHWNFAYDFVRLHQPSALYGVNSLALGSGQKDQTGWNAGLYELASGAEVLAYFDRVLNEQLLPSGRVMYYPGHVYLGKGRLASLETGAQTHLTVRRKTIDATFYKTSIPATHTPSFQVGDGVDLIAPNALSEHISQNASDQSHFCILGAGKTAMDVGVWLLENGISGSEISWVKPRDSWLMSRRTLQPGAEFFQSTIGTQAKQMMALAEATSAQNLFERLEQDGHMLRIFPDIQPSMYHCAVISEGEIALLRQIGHIVRQGRVQGLSTTGMTLEQGDVIMPDATVYIDCTASAVARRPSVPIFQDNLVTPQMVRTCQPTFSAAMVAHIELMAEPDCEKNALCRPLPIPDTVEDYIPFILSNMMNQYVWLRSRDIREWMLNSRLDGFSKIISEIPQEDTDKIAVLNEFRTYAAQAISNVQNLAAKHG